MMSPPRGIHSLTPLHSASQSFSLIFHRSAIQMEWFRQSSSAAAAAALFEAFRENAVGRLDRSVGRQTSQFVIDCRRQLFRTH